MDGGLEGVWACETGPEAHDGATGERARRHREAGAGGLAGPPGRHGRIARSWARAVEQYYIEMYREFMGSDLMNRINSISPRNPYYDMAREWAEGYLRKNGMIL